MAAAQITVAISNHVRMLAEGYRRFSVRVQAVVLLFAGALAALSLPPFGVFPILLFTLPPLVLSAQAAKTKKQAFFLGWFWGFGHFLLGLYWISNALLVEPEKFAWLVPFAASLIPSVLACYIGVFALLVRGMRAKGALFILAVASAWVLVEFLRATLFSGFPWNLLGYAWMRSLNLLQLASITGVYGLSLLAVIFGLLPLLLIEKKESAPRGLLILIALFAAAWAFGYARLNTAEDKTEDAINVRLVQGNISQHFKWDEKTRSQSFLKYVEMTQSKGFLKGKGKKRLIVWPETAIPFALEEEPQLVSMMQQMLPEDAVIVSGALRVTPEGKQPFEIWNDIYAVSRRGVEDHYDKVRLVPFGEYVPLRWLLPFIDKITYGSGDFSSGPGPENLKLQEDFPLLAPLVCYEVIFPDGVIAREPHAAAIVNVTNDAWFGNSTGPYQHLAMARVRAIEQGVPLLRAANTGISAVVDAYGRNVITQPLNTDGVLDTILPRVSGNTFFSFYGSIPVLVLCFFFFFLGKPLLLNSAASDSKKGSNHR